MTLEINQTLNKKILDLLNDYSNAGFTATLDFMLSQPLKSTFDTLYSVYINTALEDFQVQDLNELAENLVMACISSSSQTQGISKSDEFAELPQEDILRFGYLLSKLGSENNQLSKLKFISHVTDIDAFRKLFYDIPTSEVKPFYVYYTDFIKDSPTETNIRTYRLFRQFYEERCEVIDHHTFKSYFELLKKTYEDYVYEIPNLRVLNPRLIDEPEYPSGSWGNALAGMLLKWLPSLDNDSAYYSSVYRGSFLDCIEDQVRQFVSVLSSKEYQTANGNATELKFLLSLAVYEFSHREYGYLTAESLEDWSFLDKLIFCSTHLDGYYKATKDMQDKVFNKLYLNMSDELYEKIDCYSRFHTPQHRPLVELYNTIVDTFNRRYLQ